MSQSAYIKLVPSSITQHFTLGELQQSLLQYREQVSLTGSQLDWDYAAAAFPYTIESKQDDRWFYLQGTNDDYRHILFGTTEGKSAADEDVHCIQVVLTDESTHGDKAKANELCKYLSKKLQAELTMFNGRTVYYYKRK